MKSKVTKRGNDHEQNIGTGSISLTGWRSTIRFSLPAQAAREEKPMRTRMRRFLNFAAAAGFILTVGLIAAPEAKAQQLIPFEPISAIAKASQDTYAVNIAHDIQADYLEPDNLTVRAEAYAASANSQAVVGPPWGAWVRAQGIQQVLPYGPYDSGHAVATTLFGLADPQGRPTVRLRVRVRAAGVVADDYSMAHWIVSIGPLLHPPFVAFDEYLQIVDFIPPFLAPIAMRVSGQTNGNNSYVCDWLGGCVSTTENSTEFDEVINFATSPGELYIQLLAVVSGNAVAAADPIIEPDPSNPDVVVTMRGMDLPPVPGPLEGVTPEELAARGIDPGPFMRLGLFDPPVPSNHPPLAQCQNVTVPVTLNSCAVASASIDNGSSDPDGDTLTLSQSPAGPYPVGNTAVTLTVSDGTLSSQCSATVTVTDGQAPTITCPANQTAAATSSTGAVVNFAPSATDNCSTLMTSCSSASGSTFPLGTTPVTCTATDGTGLQNSCSFTVTVTADTLTQLNGLIATVQGLPIQPAVKLALKAPLLVAKAALEHNKPQVACGSLRVFEGIVKQLRQANKLTAAQATQLTTVSQSIRVALGCP